MASESILSRLEAEFDAPPESIHAIATLLERGAPAQFICRFRRDETGDLGEERVTAIEERWHFLQDLESRKESILQQAEQSGSVTDELKETLANTFDQDLLDDIYQSFRPKRRTPGVQAEEKGVGPLAQAIHFRSIGDKTLQEAAAEYQSEEHGLTTPEAVLEGVLYILAERYASDPKLRARFRDELSRGVLKATATAPDRKGAKRYKDFFALEEPVRRIPANRMLALRRAEREGIIKVELCLPEKREIEIFREQFASDLTEDSPVREFLDMVFAHAYEHHVRPACENDIRRRTKEKADRETVRNYSRNLRSQLMSPPLGPKPAMAVRASSRSVWLVALAEDGSVLEHTTLHLEGAPPPQKKKKKSKGQDKPAETAEKSEDGDAPAAEAPATETSEAQATDASATEVTAGELAADVTEAAPASAEDNQATSEPEPTTEPAAEATTPVETTPVETTTSDEAPATESASDEAAPEEAADEATPDEEESATPQEPKSTLTRDEVIEAIRAAITKHDIAAIAVPHGRRQELAEKLVAAALAGLPDTKAFSVPIDEAMSAVFATSASGRKALPGSETGIRTAVSLARRMQDPLLELLAMEPRELGLGQSSGEVHQGLLNRHLDSVIASCLARVGVDLNRVKLDNLARLPGMNRDLGRTVLEERQKRGGFKTLEELKSVEGMTDDAFTFCAGFLRVEGGDEPLDATSVHPENYEIVAKVAEQRGVPVPELFGKSLRDVELQPLVTEETGRLRILDMLHGLSSMGTDPRGELTPWKNDTLGSMDDLKVDMQLRGRVTNLTEFGAFVDLGIGQDGLIHVSQIPGQRLRNPDRMLRVGEVVTVFVVRVDQGGKRISLTMHKPRHLAEGRRATVGERMEGQGRRGRGRRRQGDQEEVMSRAARAPQGRRGDGRRGGPRRPGGKGGERGYEGGGGRRGGRDAPRGAPRVITVESGKQVEQSLGHKGELRSLSGLRNLLSKEESKKDSGQANES